MKWPWLAWLLVWGPAVQAEGLLWQVQGPKARHWMIGSVHLLPASVYPLPSTLEYAYRDAQGLVFEADIDALADPATQAQLQARGRTTRPLQELLPTPLYQALERRAKKIGLPLPPCEGYMPWFCAALLESTEARQSGFDSEHGIDPHFYRRAQKDRKPRTALETVPQQLAVLAAMPEALSVQMLAASLDESVSETGDPQALQRIWTQSDLAALEKIERALRQKYPAVHARLLADRNRAWLPKLRALFGSARPQLVIVGALHQVGPEGLPALLWQSGFATTRMTEKTNSVRPE